MSGLAACMEVLRTGEADGLKNRLEDRARRQWSATPGYVAWTRPDNSGDRAEDTLRRGLETETPVRTMLPWESEAL